MTTPKLIKMKLPIELNDKRISEKKSYLAKIDGDWYAGKFTKQDWADEDEPGWNFEAVYDAGYQYDYDGWQELYEIARWMKRRG